MKEAVKSIIKKVTLEMVYDIVDTRTTELRDDTRKQFSELRDDTNRRLSEIKDELREVRAEIRNINSRLDTLFTILLTGKREIPESKSRD
ncbi:MAG: hypothetical protein GXP46_13085 [Deferribacteres bacterium]|nr:hypothetical protein [Deferribacteres bacterium]